jgi:hypothetical protein
LLPHLQLPLSLRHLELIDMQHHKLVRRELDQRLVEQVCLVLMVLKERLPQQQ